VSGHGPLPHFAISAFVVAVCCGVFGAVLGALGVVLLLLRLRVASPRAMRLARDMLLLLALPGAGAAVAILARSLLPPDLPRVAGLHWIAFLILPCCLLPLAALPSLWRLPALPPGQARAARGLGADAWQSLRLVWLPQLAPALLTGAVAAAMPGCGLLAWLLLQRR
jgi:ABC-type spermidine/putrescine transport system permease subunit II